MRLRLAVILLCTLLLPACSPAYSGPTPTATAWVVYLRCDGCPDINIWQHVRPGGSVVGRVPNGTRAGVLDTLEYQGETWYYVNALTTKGWVKSTLAKPR